MRLYSCWLVITVMLLHVGHSGAFPGRTVRLEYPTRHTCQDAQEQIDKYAVEQIAKRWYGRRHSPKKVIVNRIKTECEPELAIEPDRNCALDWWATCSEAINRI